MIQYKFTKEGLEIIRYLPFIGLDQLAGEGVNSNEFSSPSGQIKAGGIQI